MIFKLSAESASYLSTQPETGMGYQVFLAKDSEKGIRLPYIVYNAKIAIPFDHNFESNKNNFENTYSDQVFNTLEIINFDLSSFHFLSKKQIVDFQIVTNRQFFQFRALREEKISYQEDTGAKDADETVVKGYEMLVRVSAFKNDIRVDEKLKLLKPGSYATTYFDYFTCVNCNLDPVDRYALPNNLKTEWAFYIQPSRKDFYKEGVVMPNFGRKGGGKEVYFEKGTSINSLIDTRPYGS